MFFTQEDFKKIEGYLKQNSQRDTDFPEIENLDLNDTVTVVHNNVNYKTPVSKISSTIVLDDSSISANLIQEKAVTYDKLSDDTKSTIAGNIDTKAQEIDNKYAQITNNLQNEINSIIKGGVALSKNFGLSDDIGITQNSLTKIIGVLFDELAPLTHKEYIKFESSVTPTTIISDTPQNVEVIADCTGSIDDFDSLEIYVNGVLVDHTSDTSRHVKEIPISQTSTITIRAIILGRLYGDSVTVTYYLPYFIGSGNVYTDAMNADCYKPEMKTTIQGDFDFEVNEDNQHIFIIIPKSDEEKFRRASFDMNGYEIQFNIDRTSDPNLVIYKSVNTYIHGTYNIDIQINVNS